MEIRPDGATDDRTADPSRLQFLQAQVSYFSSHLGLADAKAAAIIAFATAISGVTADRIRTQGIELVSVSGGVATISLVLSLLAILFGFNAVRPRTAASQLPSNRFSWTRVARQPIGSHPRALEAISTSEMLHGLADTTETLARVIAQKYVSIGMAAKVLLPGTLMHILYWLLA